MTNRTGLLLCAVVCLSLLTSGCLVPPMASLQGARSAEKSQLRITPFYSAVDVTGGDETVDEVGQQANTYGLLFGAGLGGNSEFQVRYDRIDIEDVDADYNFTSVGFKVGAAENIIALTLPVGFYWGNDISVAETFQFEPGVLLSAPLASSIELNGGLRAILPVDPDLVQRIVLNGSVSLSTDVSRWALMPELGYSVAIDDSDAEALLSYGIALVYFTPILK